MLTRIEISNYRGFKTYRMDGLARVNLLVGKNNCGKTAMLEAVHLVASNGSPWILADAAVRRGEIIIASRDGRETSYADLSHFFFGHELTDGSSFSIRSDDGFPKLTVRLTAQLEVPSQSEFFDPEREPRPAFGLLIEGATTPSGRERLIPVSDMGGMLLDPRLRFRASVTADAPESRAVTLIPPDSLGPRRLAELWRQVILEARQEAVVQGLRIIEPGLAQIIFLPGDYAFRGANSPSGIVTVSAGSPRPVPLGTLGDGMRRLLALAIALSNASRGLLLLDEIDTGLHYSVMPDMWKLVVGTAVENDIQVFATTHSWDCVHALSVLCQREPHMMEHVAIHKIARELDQSVPFAGEKLVRAVTGGIELR